MKEDDLMNTVGLMIPTKEHEHRRVLRPCDIASMKHKEQLYLCHGYGEICGFSDEDYRASGAHIDDPKEVMRKQIICDPKNRRCQLSTGAGRWHDLVWLGTSCRNQRTRRIADA